MDIDKLTAGRELDVLVAEAMGCPVKTIPDYCKNEYGEVEQKSALWREIIQKAIDTGVKLKIRSAYKGVSYVGELDGWSLYFSISYSDSYKASDEIILDGEPEGWMDNALGPGVSIEPAKPKPYSTDIAAAWEVRQWLLDNIGGVTLIRCCDDECPEFCEVYDGDGIYARVWAKTTPEALCKAALKASKLF